MRKKEYFVSDLFFTAWKDLKPSAHAKVYALQQSIKALEPGTVEYGMNLIAILRLLRKRPLLVDKINVEQAVDIYNDLTFLNEPWYFFPHISSDVRTPDDKMARSSFDQFIYADNEFTSYIAALTSPLHPSPDRRGDGGEGLEQKYLSRLAATLYPLYTDEHFDPETVEERAQIFAKAKTHEVTLPLIFFTYGHVRSFVVNRCKHLLPKGSSEEAVKPSGPMWHQIKHQAARTLVFGNFESLGKANMYNVLDHLELLAKENITSNRQPATSN